MAKRGRKPNPDKKKNYFSDQEEEAVIVYLTTTDLALKNKIFVDILYPALNKMVESIIRKYKLYIPNESFEDTFNETLSFLITKADKYNPEKHKKAYSYYGTICKNHLIGLVNDFVKKSKRVESYDNNISSFTDNIRYSSVNDRSRQIANDTVDMLIKKVDTMLLMPEEYNLKDTEVKMGKALKTLLENWDFVLTTDGSNKLNKNAILFFLRETTGFDTKGIRDNMKKFKNEFVSIKKFLLT